jgi:hypothetical protein
LALSGSTPSVHSPGNKNRRKDANMNLSIGQKFPDFELPDHCGATVKLSELVGKFPFILSFYRGYW